MRLAETVTFGGSGLDRAYALRRDPREMARLTADPRARILPLWRGKPLVVGEARDRLGWIRAGHPVLRDAREAALFLGLDATGPRFAADISPWKAQEGSESALADAREQHHPALPEKSWFIDLRGIMVRLSPRDAEMATSAKALLGWHHAHGFCPRCGARTESEQAGWQRRCQSCGTRHFPRTDPVVIMLVTRANKVLLGRSPGWPEGMVSLLAGFVEPGETVEAAVRREVFEETQVKIGKVSYLASQPWPYPASLMLGCRAQALSEAITIDPVEIESARWLAREDLLDAFAGNHCGLHPARVGSIARFLLENWLADRLD